jgi:putative transposase
MATIGELKAQVERVWRATCQTPWENVLEQRLREAALVGIKATLEAALVEELNAALGFSHFQRLPSGSKSPEQQRSGSFHRQLLTSYGLISSLRVPKLRRGNAKRTWHILTRYQRLAPRLLDQLLFVYALGLSLRDLQEALYVLLGETLSREAVSRVTEQVQASMQAWREQPLRQTPAVLIVDGVWVNILYPTGTTWTDQSGHIRQQVRGQERVILAALAVYADGSHQLLEYVVAEAEDSTGWTRLWRALLTRGLDPKQLSMVVSDGSKGVLETLGRDMPKVKLQRCVVHKVRSFERNLRYSELELLDAQTQQVVSEEVARHQRRSAISSEALAIFQAPTREVAEQRLSEFESRWQGREAQAVKTFKHGLKRCFTFYQFEQALHPHLRSTNLLERFFREFRSRADEMGAFANETSCLLVFHLVMLREHAKHDRVDFAKTG